jgi:hypothetical protein
MTMNNSTILARFTDPDECLHAAEKLVNRGVKIREIYSPFPIHGIDAVLGSKKTQISTAAFFYGVTGATLGLLMMWYMNIQDWAMIIGGKPSFSLSTNLPAFIPVAFEITVLIAAHGMIGTYFFRTRLFPGLSGRNPVKRSTDDLFVMEILPADNSKIDLSSIKHELTEWGAVDITDDTLRYIED